MNNEKGLTLVELIVSMAIASLIFLVASNFLMFGLKTHKSTEDEFTTQSNLRLLSTSINKSIRNSSATFTMYKDEPNNLTDKWNYIMVSKDQKSVIKYEWDESQKKHIESTIVNKIDGTTYRIEFSKDSSESSENLIKFNIIANINGREKKLESELSGLNSLQVIDKRTGSKISNTIAYRLDPRPAAVSNSQATVAMVLDRSGSMARNMMGKDTSTKADQRIYKLRGEANRLIDSLAENPNVYISLNPFSSTANLSEAMKSAQVEKLYLKSKISSMTADGGTNTGDGMRRAYHRISEFNSQKDLTKPTKNFMIILVDGVTTFSSVYRASPISYVVGNSNIDDIRIESKYSTLYTTGRYYGLGNALDTDGSNYVSIIGKTIRDYKNKFDEGIKVYVIGFSNVKEDHGSLGDIAKATSGSNKFYEAGDETALRNIFDMIQKDIDDSLWHIGGPS